MIKKALFILSVFTLLLPTFVWAFYPAEVARTGQTSCYDAAGNPITCSGTGQDGDVLAGAVWPDPRFNDRGDGTVTDGLTGLVWARDANIIKTNNASFDTDGTAGDGAVTWQHALDYVAGMNAGTYPNMGYNDWRLPNVNELESLVNAQLFNPVLSLNHSFTNVQLDYYWSSTSYAYYTRYAWVVHLGSGLFTGYYKTSYYCVWPVRAGQCGALGNSVLCLPKTGQTLCYNTAGGTISCSGTGQDGELQAGVAWPSQRFVDNGETVTDSLTGLEWTKNANIAGATKTWQAALDYVKTLNTDGHSDWRLPNERELHSLADYSKSIPPLPQDYPFTNVQSGEYWSSTSYAYFTNGAWLVGMDDGGVCHGNKANGQCVWPVRAGQVGNSVISSTSTTVGSTTTVPTTSVISSTTTSAGPSTTTSAALTTTTVESATTTTTVKAGLCPATKVLGADNPKLENLRDFRDSRLAQSSIGRRVIQIYYTNAGSINAALDRSPALQAVARGLLEAIAPMAGKNQ